jgi:hypothetical protein
MTSEGSEDDAGADAGADADADADERVRVASEG